MELLGVKDFKDTMLGPNWSPFQYLLEVARVGQQKLQKQSFKIKGPEENKKHGLGLKYFQNCNAPEPQSLFKEESMSLGLKYFPNNNAPEPQSQFKEETVSFKQGSRLNKNGNLKRKQQSEAEEEGEGLKLKGSKKLRLIFPDPPPDLPENFKQHILQKMGGWGLIMVIQKRIFYSDVNPQASRFSIPFSQIQTHGFLTEKEVEDLDAKKSIKVCLLEPSMKETFLTFKRWNMEKTSSYVLTTKWNSVVKNNGLEIDDIVQLWSFRVESTLCFALVKVQTPTRN